MDYQIKNRLFFYAAVNVDDARGALAANEL